MNAKIRIVLILLLFIAPAAFAAIASRWPNPSLMGQAAPNFHATLLDDTPVALSDFRGQTVMLNFWATWCAPCRLEMPLLQGIHEQGEVVVLAINNGETTDQIQQFLTENTLALPVVLDANQRLQRGFGIVGYPTTVVVSPDGTVVAVHRGLLTEQALEQLLRGHSSLGT